MRIEKASVSSQKELSGGYRVMVLDVPAVSSSAKPGQFIHLRVPDLDIAVLRRPFSIYKSDGSTISVLYKVVGKGTSVMAKLTDGAEVDVIGPLGNGFPECPDDKEPLLVAGGYGVAPLCFLASTFDRKGTLFVGARCQADILCIDDFEVMGWDVRISTEDGSLGTKGRVTDLIDSWLKERAGEGNTEFFCCGPDGMLKAVGDRAIQMDAMAWLSLDKHMGCGVGACLACVQKIVTEDGTEVWARVCKDGPIFESRQIVWDK
jgi:dihydroorotate dehydrogenase electron transfer subunit